MINNFKSLSANHFIALGSLRQASEIKYRMKATMALPNQICYVKQPVEELIEKLKKDIERDDTDAMKADSKALEDKLMEIGQAVYQQQQASGAAGAQPGPDAAQGKKDDGVVDAEVVDD